MGRHFRQGFSGIPCFCHGQASGKKRGIDNGKKARSNDAAQYTDKFCLPNAFVPAEAAQALRRCASSLGYNNEKAAKTCNTQGATEHLPHNNVMVRNPETGSVYLYAGLSYFPEAAPRRLLWLLWTMYVDEGNPLSLRLEKH